MQITSFEHERYVCIVPNDRDEWRKAVEDESCRFYSVVWRVFLGDLSADSPSTWASTALVRRRAYRHLCTKYERAWDDAVHCSMPDDAHPLQEVGKSLWQRRNELKDLHSLVNLDIDRLSEPLEQSEQRCLARILHVWAYTHPDPGYRQGMHEIAARLWKVRAMDASVVHNISKSSQKLSLLRVVLTTQDTEADTYFLFSALIQRLLPLYVSTDRAGSPALIKAILHRADPSLGAHLQSLQLEWTPIILRWHRLLYMHEFSEHTSLELWDALFDAGHVLQIVPYVSAVLLLLLRDTIVTSDYIETMQLLMHLPELSNPRKLVYHAVQLLENPSASMGAAIAKEYNQHPPPPEPTSSKIDTAKNILKELAAGLVPSDNPHTVWSPKTEDRLRTESANHTEQYRRAMLSLDSVHDN